MKLFLLIWLLSCSAFAGVERWNTSSLQIDLPCAEPLAPMQFVLTRDYRVENAFLLLWAASLAESPDRAAITQGLQKWGFSQSSLIGDPGNGAFAYLAESDDFHLLSFRGTNSMGESFANSLFFPASFAKVGFAGSGHRGMINHFAELLKETMAQLESVDPAHAKPVLITGHSLGGAMALMHALHLAKTGWDVIGLYTSAQPHLGDARFNDEVELWLKGRYFRMETAQDLTPRIPPTAASSTVFGEIIPARAAQLQKQIARLVDWMDYDVSRGALLQIGSTLQTEATADQNLENSYWESLRGSFKDADSLPSIYSSFMSRMQDHPPPNYMCAFLKAYAAP